MGAQFIIRSHSVRGKELTRGCVMRFTLAYTEIDMLWTIFVVLSILWLLGFSLHVGGSLIHLLLVVGLMVLVINLLSGRRSAFEEEMRSAMMRLRLGFVLRATVI